MCSSVWAAVKALYSGITLHISYLLLQLRPHVIHIDNAVYAIEHLDQEKSIDETVELDTRYKTIRVHITVIMTCHV